MKLNKKDQLPKSRKIHLRTTNPKLTLYVYYNSDSDFFHLLFPHYTSLMLELTPIVSVYNMMIYAARELSLSGKSEAESTSIIYEEEAYTFQDFFDTYCQGESLNDWASKDVKV